MENTIEIKSMNKEAAIQRALKILEANSNDIVSVVEKQKSKSFLGFFNKEGVYLITIDKEKKSIKIKDKSTIIEEKKEELASLKIVKKEENIIFKEEEKIKSKNSIKKEQKEIKAKIIIEKTKILLNNMNLNLEAEISSNEGKYYIVNLFGEDNGIIIGKKGKTLNSFEYLLNSIVKDCRIEVDVEGFKEKRNETLRELAKKMSEKAIQTNKIIRLNPMPPRERKIIHEVVNRYSELDTFSEGKDPKRYIVIKKKK
ncbi:MAG: protein jag [Fusobacteriaceae bacterium]